MASATSNADIPVIKAFGDLSGIVETYQDEDRRLTKFTTCCYVFDENNKAYFGQIFKPKKVISIDEFASALQRIPDEEIYPKIPPELDLTVAPAVNTDEFMAKLEDAVHHLHSLGLAHNDLNPNNVMADESAMPVLIDFGLCRPFGKRLMRAGALGWCDDTIFSSDKQHDVSGLEKMRKWLVDPCRTFL